MKMTPGTERERQRATWARWIMQVFLLATLLCAVIRAQEPAPQNAGTARVSGRVYAGDTGKPLRGAFVNVIDTRAGNPTERQGRWIATDANGRWEFQDLAPGRYTISVTKSGYLKVEYGQQRPFERGKTLELKASQILEKIDVTLPRGSAITGRIFDEFGDPAAAVMVRALRHRYVDGQRQLTPLSEGIEVLANGGGDITDDLGQFRIYGLSPGDYYVSALFSPSGESAGRTGYLPTYYPGTASAAEARRVTMRLGEEAQNINLNLVTARYAVVSGTVLNSLNAPVKASLQLSTADPSGMPVGPGTTAADGTFAFRHVPPGEYRLRVYGAQSSSGVPEFASMPVVVGGDDVAGIVLITSPGATASGRVVFEDGAKPDTRLFVRSAATVPGATFSNTSVGVNPDLSFAVSGLTERQTFRLGAVPDGWFLKSVMHAGRDITDAGYDFKPGERVSGIQILLTRRATTLTGIVQGDGNEPIGDYTVVAFAADGAKRGYLTRFVRSARPNQDATFTIRALPADDYLVIALEYLESGQEFDPEQLRVWEPLATKVTLVEGGTQTLSLKLAR
jgi:Carboxypeptidase regulatory-like domain